MKTLTISQGQVKQIANVIQTEYRFTSEGRSYTIHEVATGKNHYQDASIAHRFEKAVEAMVYKKAHMMSQETTKFHHGFKDWEDVAMKNRIYLAKIRKAVISLLSGHKF